MFSFVTLPNFVHFYAFTLHVQRYSEFFFLNVSLLTILRVFDRNNFPFSKKICQIFCLFCITLFFLEITSIFVLCQKKVRNLLLEIFHLFTTNWQKFFLEGEKQHLTAFLQILWCQSSVISLNLPCPRRYLGFRFREIFTLAAVFRGFASFGRER